MKERIINYIKAAYPALYLVSHEESRVEAMLKDVATTLKFRFHAWSCTNGIINIDTGEKRGNTEEPLSMLDAFNTLEPKSILLVRDFHLFVEDKNPVVWRKIKDVLTKAKANNRVLVILGCRMSVPAELEKELTVLDFSLPDREQLRIVYHSILRGMKMAIPSPEEQAKVLNASTGMTTIEAECAYALSLVEAKEIKPEIVYREKCQAVKKNGLLEVVESTLTLDDIGGLDALKEWLLRRREIFSDEAKKYGLPAPKGILAVGQPGTGKSLTAKALRSVLGVPLLRLDGAKLFGSLVGQSEANWRAVHATAKAMAPCILFIDEVDGALGGANGGDHDGGTTVRVIKSVLQDMQDNSEGIFYMMTANDIDRLPSPLLRRLDEVWYVDLPNATERRDIWRIQIKNKRRDPEAFDLDALSEISDGFSGSEIEKVFNETLAVCFADGQREPETDDVLSVCRTFKPVSKTMHADIERRRNRLQGLAKPATTPTKDESPVTRVLANYQ